MLASAWLSGEEAGRANGRAPPATDSQRRLWVSYSQPSALTWSWTAWDLTPVTGQAIVAFKGEPAVTLEAASLTGKTEGK